ncbi:CLUMA_CG020771, isoform A [Clunio marinus]|uniref:CLUMA_CG020771, isoform A n=1 Tax=Clunio marinus TaxID=568069 RepID=A0A1J1J9W6_9DIPT|nr:CLUMA_CG020771, isoform A [Clunio marinus]
MYANAIDAILSNLREFHELFQFCEYNKRLKDLEIQKPYQNYFKLQNRGPTLKQIYFTTQRCQEHCLLILLPVERKSQLSRQLSKALHEIKKKERKLFYVTQC